MVLAARTIGVPEVGGGVDEHENLPARRWLDRDDGEQPQVVEPGGASGVGRPVPQAGSDCGWTPGVRSEEQALIRPASGADDTRRMHPGIEDRKVRARAVLYIFRLDPPRQDVERVWLQV